VAPNDDDHPAWIERVVAIAAALGANPVRVRWRLVRMVENRRRARRRRAQVVAHVAYEHRVCPTCSAVSARDEAVCARCKTPLPSRAREMLGRLGLVPQAGAATLLIAIAIAAAYMRTGLAGHDWFSMSSMTLARHGGNLARGLGDAEPWRFVTSTLLHVGMWHLAFNLFALASVGPRVERRYSPAAMLVAFVVTGVIASITSVFTGLAGVSAGASGALMGLIGLIAIAAHRDGTTIGRNERNAMLRWAAYTMVFGVFVGADNRAHLGGLVAGVVLGLLVPVRAVAARAGRAIANLLGAIALATIIGAVALILWPPDDGAELARVSVDGVDPLTNDYLACKLANSDELPDGMELDASACERVDAARRDCARKVPAFLDGVARRRWCLGLQRLDAYALRPDSDL